MGVRLYPAWEQVQTAAIHNLGVRRQQVLTYFGDSLALYKQVTPARVGVRDDICVPEKYGHIFSSVVISSDNRSARVVKSYPSTGAT
jgi:hypothetical protein